MINFLCEMNYFRSELKCKFFFRFLNNKVYKSKNKDKGKERFFHHN